MTGRTTKPPFEPVDGDTTRVVPSDAPAPSLAPETHDAPFGYAGLTQTNERLAASNQALESFAHAVAHDLKEPIRSVRLLASFMAEDAHDPAHADPDAAERLSKIDQLCGQALAMVEVVLNAARSGEGLAPRQPVSVAELCAQAASGLMALAQEHHVTITCDAEAHRVLVMVDRVQAARALRSLITNAIKQGPPEGGSVAIGVRETPTGHAATGHTGMRSTAAGGRGGPGGAGGEGGPGGEGGIGGPGGEGGPGGVGGRGGPGGKGGPLAPKVPGQRPSTDSPASPADLALLVTITVTDRGPGITPQRAAALGLDYLQSPEPENGAADAPGVNSNPNPAPASTDADPHRDSILPLIPAPNDAADGTGAGLAMTRAIVENHGGRLWVEPRPQPPGAVLCITLPRA